MDMIIFLNALFVLLSPTRLNDSGKQSESCKLSETNSAHPKFSQVSSRTSAIVTTVVVSNGKLLFAFGFGDHRFFGHFILFSKGETHAFQHVF